MCYLTATAAAASASCYLFSPTVSSWNAQKSQENPVRTFPISTGKKRFRLARFFIFCPCLLKMGRGANRKLDKVELGWKEELGKMNHPRDTILLGFFLPTAAFRGLGIRNEENINDWGHDGWLAAVWKTEFWTMRTTEKKSNTEPGQKWEKLSMKTLSWS